MSCTSSNCKCRCSCCGADAQSNYVPTERLTSLMHSNERPTEEEEGDYQKIIDDAEKEIRLINDLLSRRTFARKQLRDHKVVMNPVRRLNEDILRCIFEIFGAERSDIGVDGVAPTNRGLWTFIHVCQSWRRVGLSTPQPWTNVFMLLDPVERHYRQYEMLPKKPQLLALQCIYAGDCQLSLTISGPTAATYRRDVPHVASPILESLLMSIIPRCYSLNIRQSTFLRETCIWARNLTALSLYGDISPSFLDSLPTTSWARITAFEVIGSPSYELDLVQLHTTMRALTALERCRISGLRMEILSFGLLRLPYLRVLHLDGGEHYGHTAAYFLSAVELPSLHSLTLSGKCTVTTTIDEHLSKPHMHPLTSLSVSVSPSDLSMNDITQLLSFGALCNLEALEIISPSVPSISGLLERLTCLLFVSRVGSDFHCILPRLKTLIFDVNIEENTASFLDVAESRCGIYAGEDSSDVDAGSLSSSQSVVLTYVSARCGPDWQMDENTKERVSRIRSKGIGIYFIRS
jgi:hypothetical protein